VLQNAWKKNSPVTSPLDRHEGLEGGSLEVGDKGGSKKDKKIRRGAGQYGGRKLKKG